MLKLDIKTEPYWLGLPCGIRVRVKPVSTAVIGAAQAMALKEYRALLDGGMLDPLNEELRNATSDSLLITALAQLAILEWEGVIAADGGEPAPVNGRTVGDLMQIWLVAQAFFKSYTEQFNLLETEGNVSAPAANGTSAAAAPTAGSAG